MSKEEERAQEAYPLMADNDKEGLEALKYIGIECKCASVFNEVQKTKQAYFIEGYHQAGKDLELTWEDIEKITDIWDDLHEDETVYIKTGYDTPEFYKEILKQFKNYKEKEEREEK